MHADTYATCMAEMWEKLGPVLPESRVLRKSGGAAVITGNPLPAANGVWLERARPSADIVADLLDEVAATGLPHCLELRPGSGKSLTELAARRNLTPGGEVPLMALDAAAGRVAVDRVAADRAGVAVRRLRPDEAPLHARVAATGFGMTIDQVSRLVNPDTLGPGLMRCYVAELDGQPVSTAIGMTTRAFTGIFNVATLPAFRGRGLGTAVTARAVADGLAAGDSGAWLQSTPAGYHVYRDLGFRTVEVWQLWLAEK